MATRSIWLVAASPSLSTASWSERSAWLDQTKTSSSPGPESQPGRRRARTCANSWFLMVRRYPSRNPSPVMRIAILGVVVGHALMLAASALAQVAARVAAGEDAWDKAACFQWLGTAGEGGAAGEFVAGP